MKKSDLLLIVGIALLASCATPFPKIPSARTEMMPFLARGNEPAWLLKIDSKSINFRGNYGQPIIKVPLPKGRPTARGTRYATDRLTVEITFTTCVDGMSADRFSESVTVLADGKKFDGCGGFKLRPESLNGTNWTIVLLDREPLLEDVNTDVQFDNGRITGHAGCNRFSGDFSQNGDMLTFRPMTSTRMMCPLKQMAQETKFLTLLGSKLTIRYSVEGNLILADNKGNGATLKQVI